ncbi:two component transcriptional regulator [Sporocytophaga myxococcoides]|uniref:Two component transcriptional regulator n=1 Tax=Sporocytophaga myxococcoides TaxID=153721 RepID=A0A098LJ79_9BACT|nr:response regulator transcription factor [Sporocytophaga myxococcoides]GAL87000.1 two component transcriptional regulator [Sporocytophaga myxococcoides]
MKVLIIEDEKELRYDMVSYLSQEGFLCESARNFSEAVDKIGVYEYDCYVIDIMLPGGTGLDLVKTIKSQKHQGGIIIVSAKNSIEDKIVGLEIGSDDYLTKPFHLSELNARIKSIIRRRSFNGNNEIQFNEIRILPDSRQVYINGKEISLTAKEYDLLLFFIVNKGRVIPKDSIAEHLWGDYMDQADSFDFIYTHIKNLRRKLVQQGAKDYLNTVYGIGYKFQSE